LGEKISLGLVGAGRRGLEILTNSYQIRHRHYLLSDSVDHPFAIYSQYADESPLWAENISDLRPTITAIFDPSKEARERAYEFCQEKGDQPELFASLEPFLQSGEYEAVVVSSPNDKHVEAVIPLLESGIDLLCEKPIATTLEDHDRFIHANAKSNSLFYVGFNLRSAPFFNRIEQLLTSNAVGRLGMITCREIREPFVRGFRYTRKRSGGSILEKVSHDFDLFNWYGGSDPLKVSAFGNQHVFRKETDAVDQATIAIEYKNGLLAMLELCLYAPFGQRTRTYELRGTEGLLRSSEQAETIDLYTHSEHHRYEVKTGGLRGQHSGGDFLQVKRFLRCLQGRDKPPASLIDAKKAAAIALAAEKAIVEGEIIEIDSKYNLR
jgi:myo-inositol 2-dehydrogenase / D-chiro-inositol 1-dehydrogenase